MAMWAIVFDKWGEYFQGESADGRSYIHIYFPGEIEIE
jgi:hypothetical protein